MLFAVPGQQLHPLLQAVPRQQHPDCGRRDQEHLHCGRGAGRHQTDMGLRLRGFLIFYFILIFLK